MENYVCFCFACWLQNLLCKRLAERVDQSYLLHINVHNYNEFDDIEILGKVLVTEI